MFDVVNGVRWDNPLFAKPLHFTPYYWNVSVELPVMGRPEKFSKGKSVFETVGFNQGMIHP